MSSSSSIRPVASWSADLPELSGTTSATLDPARIEAAVREGYEAGVAAGHADGFEAGARMGQASVDADRRNLSAVLLALRDQLHAVGEAEAAMRASFEGAVVDAALAIAGAILERELAVAADPGRDALVRALDVAPAGIDAATVRLHPDDLARLGSLDDLAPGATLRLVGDRDIEPGGCVLQVGDTSIDSSVSAALARVAAVLELS